MSESTSTPNDTYPWVITPLSPPQPPQKKQEYETNPYSVALAPENTPRMQSFEEFYHNSFSKTDLLLLSDAANNPINPDIDIQAQFNYNDYAKPYDPNFIEDNMNDPYNPSESERTAYVNPSSYAEASGGQYHYPLTQIQNYPSSGTFPSEGVKKKSVSFDIPDDDQMDTRD